MISYGACKAGQQTPSFDITMLRNHPLTRNIMCSVVCAALLPAVHHLVGSLSQGGLPGKASVVGILPITIDTPANRAAFGDKADLFRLVIEHYARGKLDSVIALLCRPGFALENIHAVFDLWARDAGMNGRGCLMVNSLAEFAEAFAAAQPVLTTANQRLLREFRKAFRAAQAEGAVRAELDPVILAAQAVGLGDGLMLHARNGGLRSKPAAILTSFLSLVRAT